MRPRNILVSEELVIGLGNNNAETKAEHNKRKYKQPITITITNKNQ